MFNIQPKVPIPEPPKQSLIEKPKPKKKEEKDKNSKLYC